MTKLIEIPRNKINAKNREAAKYWKGVFLYGHYIGGKAVPKRAVLYVEKRPDAPSCETVMAALNLKEAP